ncbi:hypothetical protein IscW_ISCW003815 [Ixodes scapularis]|uniref:Uncharacterized protein n=1 Tax=Ixodes scapularis TaxID=6945 RepID=B7PHT9_IXOSC|nr:hypothetical protein IscW_ISCW003815 [Ixodes scapularis]|eukprot:XP_002403509.1 hypothetical protein IscW_ISCW003815 [Ixodes scapularis]
MLGLQWARNSGLKADTERISVYTNCNESIDALQGHEHVGTTEHTMKGICSQLLTDKEIAVRVR